MSKPAKTKPRKLPPMTKGTLVMWNDPKGFGFIRKEDTDEDYFVHISSFKKGLTRRPEIGDEIHFRSGGSSEKKRATFALIPALEPEPSPVGATRFELNPKPRSWWVNLLIVTPLMLSCYLLFMARNPLPFFFYVTLSILTMFLYGTDKANAATHKWRVPELYFHLLEFMGGWPGALIAQSDFRHKTRQSMYLWILHGIVAIHVMGWIIYFYWTAHQTEMGLY